MRTRNILFLFWLMQSLLMGTVYAQQTNVAYQDSHVRFTVIADGAFRLEYAPDGAFVDDKSFVAVRRSYPEVAFKVKTSGKWVEIATAKAVLKYKKNSGLFTADNLSIRSAKGLNPAFQWKPGDRQKGNLKGTLRTLDRMNGDMLDGKTKVELPDGLLATDGWTWIDDSKNFLFDHSDWEWVKVRPDKNGQDWYFLAYGHDYKQALKDFTLFAGKVPLPPRYAFGYWWSRYWAYNDNELRNLIDNFHLYNIPIDVLVIDMDWHYVTPGKGGWTGWTWNKCLYPDHKQLLRYLKSRNLQVTLNLHPADGVASYEEQYPAMAKDMGIDPASKQTIPWVSSDKRFMKALFKNILHPMEKEGIDFWWIDWQQWMYDRQVDSLNNTWWINYCFYSDMERNREERPMIYHRWGGLGNHRYPIGFSGDTHITWKSLQYQPYFNATASNVLYGYWGHDLGGHMSGKIEPEMYARWMQFGTYSPIMRTHTGKDHGMEKEPWAFGQQYLSILSQTIRQRYELVPYIYTMARKDYDEALSLCRPMYYDYPEAPEAYDAAYRNEYMFGDRLLVAPVVTPLNTDGYSHMKIWLPEGSQWYEWHTGTLLDGGQVIERAFAIDEYAVYVKAGSIIPMYTDQIKNLRSNDSEVVVTVFPGGNGTFSLYEDNGNDKNYDKQYAFTKLSSVWNDNDLTVTIGARRGQYTEMPASRKFSVKIVGEAVPERVTVNGKETAFDFDGERMELTVAVPDTDCGKEKIVTLHYPAGRAYVADGIVGKMKHVEKCFFHYRDNHPTFTFAFTEDAGFMLNAGRSISYHPEKIQEYVMRFNDCYGRLPQILEEQQLSSEEKDLFLRQCNWTKPVATDTVKPANRE